MIPQSDVIRRALAAGTRSEVLAALLPGRPSLPVSEIQSLTRHLEALGETKLPLRIGVLHTYTSDLLTPYLRFEALLQGLEPDIYYGPYGSVVQEATSSSGLVAHNPDLTVLLLQWEDLDPGIAGLPGGLSPSESASLAKRVRVQFLQQVGAVRQAVGGHLVLTLLPPPCGPGLGNFDAMAPNSQQGWRSLVKADIASALRTQLASTSLLDLDESVATVGRDQFFDLRWWYTARSPFSPAAAQDLARRVIALGAVLKRPRAKVIVLDADNTLWGGIIGEDGMDGIALGPEYPGNAYVAFQQRLIQYQQRGFILALCSKNNEADVLEVLRNHPHQVLREAHFVALRINWEPKPQNLQTLAEQLKLGLDSFVFVDDSAHECDLVRQTLPIVEVVQTPSRPVEIPTCLDRLARLEVIALTDEDRRKTELYVQERSRSDLAATSIDTASYLRSLNMEMSVTFNDTRQIARIAQLTQKTNQFNLTTQRYTEDAIARLSDADDWLVAVSRAAGAGVTPRFHIKNLTSSGSRWCAWCRGSSASWTLFSCPAE